MVGNREPLAHFKRPSRPSYQNGDQPAHPAIDFTYRKQHRHLSRNRDSYLDTIAPPPEPDLTFLILNQLESANKRSIDHAQLTRIQWLPDDDCIMQPELAIEKQWAYVESA